MELNMETFETYVSKMLDDGGFDLDRILTRVKWIGRKKKKEIETRKRKHGVDSENGSKRMRTNDSNSKDMVLAASPIAIGNFKLAGGTGGQGHVINILQMLDKDSLLHFKETSFIKQLCKAYGNDMKVSNEWNNLTHLYKIQYSETLKLKYVEDFPGLEINPFHCACKLGRFRDVRTIVETFDHDDLINELGLNNDFTSGALDDRKVTGLGTACRNGKLNIVKYLVHQKGIDVNKPRPNGTTPFFSAVEKGHQDIVNYLLKIKDIDAHKTMNDGQSPIFIAADRGHKQILGTLLDTKGADVNKAWDINDQTPLWRAVHEERENDILKMLINAVGIDKNKKCQITGESPLHIAANQGSYEIVQLLLSTSGIDVNTVDNNGCTPLWDQANGPRLSLRGPQDVEMINLLLNRNDVNPNKANHNGQTPLWAACHQGFARNASALLKADNIDVHKADNEQRTPLYIAAKKGHLAIVRLLTNASDIFTSINTVSNSGYTALDMARRLPYYNDKRQRIIDVLRSKGGLYRADSGTTAPAVQP